MPIMAGSIVAKMQLDINDFATNMKLVEESIKQTEQKFSGFTDIGKRISNVGMGLTMGLTLPIIGAGVASFKLASDLNENVNKVNVVFKDNAKQVLTWSDSTLTKFGLAKSTALDMASVFGDMGTSMGQTTDKSSAMSISIVSLAADMASFKNISVDRAQTALVGIYTGETESLKAMGIVMTQVNLEQYAASQGIKTKIKDMQQEELVQLRYNYVMSVTKNAQGDFNRTQDQTANQMRITMQGLKELGTSFGTYLLPMFTPLIAGLNSTVKWFGSLDEGTKKNVISFLLVAATIGPIIFVLGKLVQGITTVKAAFAMVDGLIKIVALSSTQAVPAIAGVGAAFSAALGPILLVVAALGLAYFAYRLYNAESIAAETRVKTLKQTCAESTKAFDTQTASIQATATTSKKLADELYTLEGRQNKTGAETARMSFLVDQLNGIMPDLNLTIDAQTGALSLNKEAIMDNVTAMKEQALAAAYVARETELYKEQIIVKEKLAIAQDKVKTAHTFSATEAKKYGVEVMGVSQAEKAAQIEVDGYSKQLGLNAASLKTNETAQASMALGIQKANQKIIDSGDKVVIKTKEQLEQEEKDKKAYYDAFEKLTEEHNSQMGSIYDTGIKQHKISMATVKKNLQQQIKDFAEWQTQLKAIAKKVPPDVYDELKKLGPEASGLLKEMNNASGQKLQELVYIFQQKFGLIGDAVLNELGYLPGEVRTAGTNAGNSFSSGITGTVANAKKSGYALGDAAKPTASLYTPGATAGQSYADGINLKTGVVRSAASNLGDAAKPSTSLYSIGKNVGDSFADGIRSQVSNVRQAAGMIASATGSSVMSILNIRSPSKVMMGLGGYVSEGFAKGITDNVDMVKKASKAMAESTKNAISGLAINANMGMNVNPVMAGGGSVNGVNQNSAKQSDSIINFYGNYSFAGRSDIDYFMNKAGQIVQRRKG